jgi:hypothetical protein
LPNLTNVTGTVTLFGSWNDDVFTGSTDDHSFLTTQGIEDARADRVAGAGVGRGRRTRGALGGDLQRELGLTLPDALKHAIDRPAGHL